MDPDLIYTVPVKKHAYIHISNGSKSVEGRLYRGIFAKMKQDDVIKFIHKDLPPIFATVTFTHPYPSFRKMVTKEGVSNVTPDLSSVDEAEALYRSIYSISKEEEFGVIAIRVSLLD